MGLNNRLGRGLDSLLPTDFNKAILTDDERVQNLLTSEIQPDPNQPRKKFEAAALAELADSIKEHGVLQPIIVAPAKSGYEIIAGERRWRAAQKAGKNSVPAIVRERAEVQRLEMALIENVQRVDLSPLEQGRSIERLHQQFNLSYQEIAKKLGKAAPTVNNLARLLQLPEDAQKSLENGEITEGHARAILALKSQPELQKQLLDLIRAKSWSVRQAEQFVTAHKEGLQTQNVIKQRAVKETDDTKALGERLGTKVTVHHTAKGGRLEIRFKDDTHLQQLYEKLGE